jgi:hypothetical protein
MKPVAIGIVSHRFSLRRGPHTEKEMLVSRSVGSLLSNGRFSEGLLGRFQCIDQAIREPSLLNCTQMAISGGISGRQLVSAVLSETNDE